MTRLWRQIKTAEWHALPNSGATNPPEHACTNLKAICNEKWYPPLFDQMIQCIWWTVALQSVCKMFITLCPSLLYLPFIGFKFSTKTSAIHTHTQTQTPQVNTVDPGNHRKRVIFHIHKVALNMKPFHQLTPQMLIQKGISLSSNKTWNIEHWTRFFHKISSWSNEQSRFIGAKLQSAWWKQKGLKRSIPALLQQRLMSQKVYVFDMVICFIVSLKLLLWLSGVYALQNA